MARGVWDAGLYLVWLDADRYTEEEKHSKYESSHTPGPDWPNHFVWLEFGIEACRK